MCLFISDSYYFNYIYFYEENCSIISVAHVS